MQAQARACIEIHGDVLRYAEVEQYGLRYRLLRLGSCDFEFDVAGALGRSTPDDSLQTVAEALEDVFEGSVASELRMVVHPYHAYPFFTPVATQQTDAARDEQLAYEAQLLLPAHGDGANHHLVADKAYTEALDEGDVDWLQVLAVPDHIHRNYTRLLREWSVPQHRLMASMQGVAMGLERLAQHTGQQAHESAPFSLLIGWYPTHTEYVLAYQHQWYYSHHATAGAPSDAAYFALALLRHLTVRPALVGEVYLYGVDIDLSTFGVLEKVFKAAGPPRLFNPMGVVGLDPQSMGEQFDVEAYAPCIGGVL